ncbi:MAG: glutamate-semialdehyde -aminomutase, partial [Actinomycetota bacterium]
MTIPFCDPTACVAAGCSATVCTGKAIPSNHAFYERSTKVIPGGVNSSIRAFKSVGGEPYIVARGEGAHIIDVEG